MNHSLTCIKTLAILLLLLFAAALPAMAEPSARPQTGGKGGAAGHGQYQYGRCHAAGAAARNRA